LLHHLQPGWHRRYQLYPIVNAPEVAILGVSKSEMKPKWNGKEFVPRLMLLLVLSYDHRVIDGADGARFITTLSGVVRHSSTGPGGEGGPRARPFCFLVNRIVNLPRFFTAAAALFGIRLCCPGI
jgi:hypothetical protein